MTVYLGRTQNCSQKCPNYFQQLPKEGLVEIYGKETSTGYLIIAGNNNDAR
jgi:hypothetical protein